MQLTIPYESYLYEPDNYLIKIIEVVCTAGLILDTELNIIYCSKKAFPDRRTKAQRDKIIGTCVELYDHQSPFRQVRDTGRPVRNFILKNGLNKSNISHIFPVYCKETLVGLLTVLSFDDLNDLNRLLSHINNQSEMALSRDIYNKIAQTESKYTFADYVGQSPQVRQVIEICKKAAVTDYPVLITGETGTGKEIIAHSLHAAANPTARRPFVRINCTAIPATLLESELFGHEKGAFTGATAAKEGKFEQAKNGTILLDEIEAMDISLQGKLLRVLEEKEFERVGGQKLIPLSARIIASTNQNLEELCAKGQFRPDLYYRLNIVEVRLPALREHPGDISLLVRTFCSKNEFDFTLAPDAMALLESYDWPGNVRELRNLMIKLSIMFPGVTVHGDDIRGLLDMRRVQMPDTNKSGLCKPTAALDSAPEWPDDFSKTVGSVSGYPASQPTPPIAGSPAFPVLDLPDLSLKGTAQERQLIEKTLAYFHGNIKKSAGYLKISRPTLYHKIEKYGIILRRSDS